MGDVQLYMWNQTRQRNLDWHNFYADQVKARVFGSFRDIEGDAERHAEAEAERLHLKYREDGAETEGDILSSHYSMLVDLRRRITLGAVAGLYHEWEMALRHFIESELARDIKRDVAKAYAYDSKVSNLIVDLKNFGWDCKSEPWHRELEACRLFVNVYKHGQGTFYG